VSEAKAEREPAAEIPSAVEGTLRWRKRVRVELTRARRANSRRF